MRTTSTKTERVLVSTHQSTVIPVAEICLQYLGLSHAEAMRRARTGDLPFPTFRLIDSQKAPLLVSCADLAAHIDSTRAQAARIFERHRHKHER